MPIFYEYSEVKETLDRVLSEDLSEGAATLCLGEESFKFFFVKLNRKNIYWSPDKLQEDLVRHLKRRNVPSKKTLRDLKENRPIFLGNVITINESIKDYISYDTATYRDLIIQSELSEGIPSESVVPSLNMFDNTRLSYKGYSILSYFMSGMGVSKKEIAEHLEKKCHSYNGKKLIDEIFNRCLNGSTNRNPGEARVTNVTAMGIWEFLKTKDRMNVLSKMTWNDMFEYDPASGSGNGKWTKPLLRSEGNII